MRIVGKLTLAVALALLSLTTRGLAVTVVDLGVADPVPVIPSDVDVDNQPLFVTNSDTADATGAVDYFRVGAGTTAHFGYDSTARAAGSVAVSVAGDMVVEGSARLGKFATPGQTGLPSEATDQQITLGVDGDLVIQAGAFTAVAAADKGLAVSVAGATVVSQGGAMTLYGGNNDGLAVVETDSLAFTNGRIELNAYSRLAATYADAPGAGDTPFYSVSLGAGASLHLDSGPPPIVDRVNPPADPPPFTGLDIAGGDGMRIASGGVLSTGYAGGAIQGVAVAPGLPGDPPVAVQRLVAEAGSAIDTSRANLWVDGMGAVDLGGSYLVGYNKNTGNINRLVARDAAVTIFADAGIGMTKELQKALAAREYHTVQTSAILQGASIAVDMDSFPVLRSALGTFTLEVGVDADASLEALWVSKVSGGVTGDGTAPDRATFRNNLDSMRWHGRVNADFADTVYDLSVSDTPRISAYGAAGQLNREVFESMVAGYAQPIGERGGIVDDGVLEFYTGASQYGPVSVAYNTVGELIEKTGSQINLIYSDLARADAFSSDYALASDYYPDERGGAFRIGAFGREEEAELDYGIAGYKYKPSGVAAGYDRVRGSFGWGATAAYAKGNYHDKAAQHNDSHIASYSGSLYGAYRHWSGLTAGAFAAYSYLDNDLADTRGNLQRRADYSADAWALGAKVGYDLCPANRMVMTPSVGVTRIKARTDSHDEHLDGVSVLRMGEVTRRSTLVPVDLAFAYDLFRGGSTVLRLNANLGYAYDLDDDGITGDFIYEGLVGASRVAVANRESDRHRFNFGAGFLLSGSRIDLSARYDYFRRSKQDAHQFRGNLGVKF